MEYNYLTDVVKLIENEYKNYLTATIHFEDIDLYTIIQNISPEYRLYVFSKFCFLLNNKDYCIGLKYAYTKTSGINTYNAKLPLEEVLNLFKKVDKKQFMQEDYEEWCKLPDIITIYRGTAKNKTNSAISWTIEEKRAIWFYKKYKSVGIVLKAKVKKEDVICYLDRSACGEKEVIVDYKKIFDIEELSKNKINRQIKFDFLESDDMCTNTDYVASATKHLLEQLALFGIMPNKELATEIFRTYEERGRYKSNYVLSFGKNQKITLAQLLEQLEN